MDAFCIPALMQEKTQERPARKAAGTRIFFFTATILAVHVAGMTATTPSVEPRVGTAKIAQHIGVTPRTIQNYRDSGKIPYVRINSRTFRYLVSEVEKALAQK